MKLLSRRNVLLAAVILFLLCIVLALASPGTTPTKAPVPMGATATRAPTNTPKPTQAPAPTNTPRPAATVSRGASISGEDWFGCTDRAYFEKLVRYAVQKDTAAFSQGLMAGMATGICVMFSDGEPVYVMDTAILSGLVKVRRSGQTAEYWTNTEAVRR